MLGGAIVNCFNHWQMWAIALSIMLFLNRAIARCTVGQNRAIARSHPLGTHHQEAVISAIFARLLAAGCFQIVNPENREMAF